MGKRLLYTPNSQIKSAMRRLWLRSRERSQRLKDDGYSCQCCGAKQSRAKGKEVYVEVHHRNGVKWAEIYEYIRKTLLCSKEELETLCEKCHKDQE